MLLVGRRDAALLNGTGAEGGLPAPLTPLAAKELRRSLLVRGLEVSCVDAVVASSATLQVALQRTAK